MNDKDLNRPRAAHKLNLQDGDRVKLVGWQHNYQGASIGQTYQRCDDRLEDINNSGDYCNFPPAFPKGERPLFIVVSRATPPVPDEIKTLRAALKCAGDMRDAAGRVSEWFCTEARYLEGPRINALRACMVAYDKHMQPAQDALPVPDEVIVLHGPLLGWSPELCRGDTHRLTLTFPAGSNTGTVVRGEL